MDEPEMILIGIAEDVAAEFQDALLRTEISDSYLGGNQNWGLRKRVHLYFHYNVGGAVCSVRIDGQRLLLIHHHTTSTGDGLFSLESDRYFDMADPNFDFAVIVDAVVTALIEWRMGQEPD